MPRYGAYTDVSAASADLESRLSTVTALIPTGQSVYNVKASAYGAVGDGSADDTAAINAAIAAVPATGGIVYFPAGTYKVTSSIAITKRGVRFVGVRDGRVTQGGGSRIAFSPASVASPIACIKLGTSGVAGDPFYDASYDTANYSGPQEFYAENMSFEYTGATTTALANGISTYGANTVAIRDFFAGTIRLRNVWFEHFHYGFWGAQSDFDTFDEVWALYCKVGVYMGPRSDQGHITGLMANYCDTGLWLDGATNCLVERPSLVGCGASTTDMPLRVGSQYSYAGGAHTIIAPWLEQQQGATVEAFMSFGGLAETAITKDCLVVNPLVATNNQVTTPHAQYLARFGNATRIAFQRMSGGQSNLLKTFKFTHASTNAHVFVDTHDDLLPTYDNTGAGSPVVSHRQNGYGATVFGGGNLRIGAVRTDQASNYQFNWLMGSESGYNLNFWFPNYTGGDQYILKLQRRIQHGSAAPTSGTWSIGDVIQNTAASAGAITAWKCISAGTPGTWVPIDVVPGSSADNGDTSPTLTPGTSAPTQRFDTALTANRTVALSTTGAWNGAKFRVVRTGLGAFTLDVGGLKTIPSATAAYVDVEYNGTAWKLAAYGAL